MLLLPSLREIEGETLCLRHSVGKANFDPRFQNYFPLLDQVAGQNFSSSQLSSLAFKPYN